MKIEELPEDHVALTDDYTEFDGVAAFGRTTQVVYVDGKGRYFSCQVEDEPKFNPYTGEKITTIWHMGALDVP